MWWMLFHRWIWFLLGHCYTLLLYIDSCRVRAMPMSVAKVVYSHAGLCPNDLNPNLWVDAMSTCMRECESDQDCETFEKCCPNVCGNKSCVAARYIDIKGNKGPIGMPKGATCDKFMCSQQGSECDIWDGQPVCKCRDRCEREPHFTCASDGMTYYNKCYMDAEACSKGISISEVTCRYHLTWPNTSPLPVETTLHPTTALQTTLPTDIQLPAIHNGPSQQAVFVGETATFLCEVSGKPRPEITWEKQLKGKENIVMRPNHVRGNVVVTNIGQLVIYNAQLQDAGIYTCTARNVGGSVSSHYPLVVIKKETKSKNPEGNSTNLPFPAAECLKSPDTDDCGEESISWYYEPKRNNCFTFTYSQCNKNRNHFDTYEACMLSCGGELAAPCSLPSLQGPCKAYEPRWAYSSTLKKCQSFVYGGCGGNENNFQSKEACEEMCPFPKNNNCKVCKPRGKMVASFCKSDFVILGRVTELTEEQESGHALVTVEEILKDEKMGLRFFGKEPLEVTLLNMDWNCPCPNITVADGQLIIMGDVHNGMAILQPDSFVGSSSNRRIRKLREIISKKTCDFIKDFSTVQ
ncbi:WAP, Kazal, immunoglobulin, Kunitz and NTR domain-containing protein 2 [Maylandia zebra]|uniref:WAP, follistatin/kazal, immunoglobulin, kunitz and netrin domain containing 2 n=3 Tax=Haplochromini TaxID=319058 RepID=A0A3Q3CAM4_HAPBU|nr:WAP, Kazal, immunoglobulin, Kunitz and NTR domain-containing protein 2 [Maylandia zebra]XP_005946936.1 WAP, Kazal, immunoglobulin, Kunitz and NTR domain-containing protein 2 [Haplochromis burtoni]XP_026019490.1 WAP, Kazal, immunoglobulin, Kunitz and NTR domain-containing protein 2-like [Astatotilapia calliptera]